MEAGKYISIFRLKTFKYDFYVHLKIVHLLYFTHKATTIWLPCERTFLLTGAKSLEARSARCLPASFMPERILTGTATMHYRQVAIIMLNGNVDEINLEYLSSRSQHSQLFHGLACRYKGTEEQNTFNQEFQGCIFVLLCCRCEVCLFSKNLNYCCCVFRTSNVWLMMQS